MLYDFLQVENRLAEFNGVVLKTIYKLAKKKSALWRINESS